jgi:BirA family biotin operon repressor/biotin-[acetyl-CoA-carboxylase] ligase
VKWPNDVVLNPARDSGPNRGSGSGPPLGKLAGILVEGRPQEGWAVLGIGVNVALNVEELPADVRAGAASLQRYDGVEPLLEDLLRALARRLAQPVGEALESWRTRDALLGRVVSWAHGAGVAEGIDDEGRLLVRLKDGTTTALSAGEVHLESLG